MTRREAEPILGVLRRPHRRTAGRQIRWLLRRRQHCAPTLIRLVQEVRREHQALRAHQSTVVAELAEGQALKGRAVVEIQRLPDDAPRGGTDLGGTPPSTPENRRSPDKVAPPQASALCPHSYTPRAGGPA